MTDCAKGPARKHMAVHSRCAGGLRTLYAGIRPTLIRAFPANAAQWLAWEAAMRCVH